MLTIISKEKINGLHPIESQSGRTSVWLEGYVAITEHLIDIAWETGGYCDLVFDEEGNLTNIIPTEKPAIPEPEVVELTIDEERDIMIMDLEYRLTLLELGL